MKKFLLPPLLGLFLLLGGCQTWTQGGAAFSSSQGYSLRIPPDWIYHPNINGNLFATKDGIFLQQALVSKVSETTPLPHTHRVLAPSLTPFEIAEAMIDDLKSDHSLQQLVIRENTPAQIGGTPGFKLVYDYHVADGMHVACARYVCKHAGFFYILTFTAPTRHYFDHDLAGFEEMVRTFAFTPEAPAQPE